MKAASPSASTRSSPVTKHQIEVITSVERRRRWSREEKERLVAATFEAGASVSEIARSADIHGSQLSRWRKQLCQISAPSVPQLVAVEVVEARPAPQPPAQQSPMSRSRKKSSMVTIELGGARRLRVESDIDSEALGRILDVLERR
ncbi:MAG: hypothetical protein EOR48_09805 [Mesorhizobium sp.]|nr:MAG: hypothetical protein EOR48_09805 [Mesorhizobium sp.]